MEKEHKITIMLCILIAYVSSPSQLCYSSMYVNMEADYSHSYEVTYTYFDDILCNNKNNRVNVLE